MGFHDVLFPKTFSLRPFGGPGWSTEIIELASGARERVSRWPRPLRSYTVDIENKTPAEIAVFLDFVHARNGAEHTFRMHDPFDHSTASDHRAAPAFDDVVLGTADRTSYELFKRYVSGGITRVRPLEKIVVNSLKMGVDGAEITTGFTVNLLTGEVLFGSAPGTSGQVLTFGCSFEVEVGFTKEVDSLLKMSLVDGRITTITDVGMREELSERVVVGEPYNFGGASYVAPGSDLGINYVMGRVLTIAPQVEGIDVLLEDAAALMPGAPYFYLHAPGASFNVKNQAGTTLLTTETGKTYEVILGKDSNGVKIWIVL